MFSEGSMMFVDIIKIIELKLNEIEKMYLRDLLSNLENELY